MGWALLQASQLGWIAVLQGARVPMIDSDHIVAKGMAPVLKKAKANARRLARTAVR